jgi:hypothetical protein
MTNSVLRCTNKYTGLRLSFRAGEDRWPDRSDPEDTRRYSRAEGFEKRGVRQKGVRKKGVRQKGVQTSQRIGVDGRGRLFLAVPDRGRDGGVLGERRDTRTAGLALAAGTVHATAGAAERRADVEGAFGRGVVTVESDRRRTRFGRR